MDRKAFKQRMQQLKVFKQQNPNKTYLDFKAYKEGGEVTDDRTDHSVTKPQVYDKIPYKGQLFEDRYGKKYSASSYIDYINNSTDEINRFDGTTFNRGINPAISLETAADFTPIGDAITVKDMVQSANNKDWTGMALASLGLIPVVGGKISKAAKTARPSKYIPTVNKGYAEKQLDDIVNRMNKQKSQQIARENSDFYIQDKSDLNMAVDRVVEDIDNAALERAKKVDQQYGTKYAEVYDQLKKNYDDMQLLDTEIDPYLGREKQGAKAKLDLNDEYKIGRDPKEPIDDIRRYQITVAPEGVTASHINHEMSHLADVAQAPGMRQDLIDNNKLLKDLSDPSQLVGYDKFSDVVRNIDPMFYFGYLNKGTEIKSFMNQTRRALKEQGKIKKLSDHVSQRTINEYMDSLQDGLSEKVIYQAFKDPKVYNKWFNAIPIVGLTGAAYINSATND